MTDVPSRGRNCVALQADMFRLAERDYGLTLPKLGALTGICPSTLKGWRSGAAMPAWGLFALGDAGVPDSLLSLVGGPYGKHVGSDEPGDGDLDTAGLDAGDVAHAIAKARSPQSPGGVAIVPQEVAAIVPLLRRSVASGRRAFA